MLTALGGVLSRVPTDSALAFLSDALRFSAGAERDAVINAIGRAQIGSGLRELAALVTSEDSADRRSAAALAAAHPGPSGGALIARRLLMDSDSGVCAQAAWALGAVGDASDFNRLLELARASDTDAAVNAVAAYGRIAARVQAAGSATSAALCPILADHRPYVRANTVVALSLAGAACGDGSLRRELLGHDPSEDVRAAAALALGDHPLTEDAKALEHCATSETSGYVASRCASHRASAAQTHPVLIFVLPQGSLVPQPDAAYAAVFSNGLLRAGVSDRRGAFFEPNAPEGFVALRKPSALAR
ncbi:MAG: HEAT repeat domain-containing protein [Candidatus Eremiobacteraeota bacterium]|nr:HEAT repeat domain-containing protein [Candidatus Eremiobacteraeota bacterium]